MNNRINWRSILKLSLIIIIMVCIVTLFFLRSNGYISTENIVHAIKSNASMAPYIMLFLYLVSPGIFLPTFYLALLAGMLWGPFWGVVVDVSGATVGSTIAFLISRYTAGDFIKAKVKNEKFNLYLKKEVNKGWRLNAFLRLNPIFPSSLIGYFFGVTSIGLAEFSISTFVFLIPASIVFVSLGSSFTEYFINNSVEGVLIKISMFAVSIAFWLFLRNLSMKRNKE